MAIGDAGRNELATLVRKYSERLDKLEQTLGNFVEKNIGSGSDAIKKAWAGGKADPSRRSFGGSTVRCSDGIDRDFDQMFGGRQKALGNDFGGFLTDVAHSVAPATFAVKDIERVSKSLSARGAQLVQKTALAETNGVTGGYTVPVQYSAELMRLAAEESFMKKLCRNLPMTNSSLFVPVLDQTGSPPVGGSVFFGGIVWTWQSEGNNYLTNAATLPKFRQVELKARDLVGIVQASNQLLNDNAIALDTILTTLFSDGMGWQYDYFTLQGNGAGQPQGMLTSPCGLSVTANSNGHFQLIDAAKMMAQMVPSSYKTSVWVAHPSVIPELISMATAGNSPFLVWLNPSRASGNDGPLANDIPGTILGRPLYITEKVPALAHPSTGAVCLVDPNKYLLGDRMAIQIEASQFPAFVTNQMTWRIVARWDGQPEQSAPITLADGSYQVSTVVKLAA